MISLVCGQMCTGLYMYRGMSICMLWLMYRDQKACVWKWQEQDSPCPVSLYLIWDVISRCSQLYRPSQLTHEHSRVSPSFILILSPKCRDCRCTLLYDTFCGFSWSKVRPPCSWSKHITTEKFLSRFFFILTWLPVSGPQLKQMSSWQRVWQRPFI